MFFKQHGIRWQTMTLPYTSRRLNATSTYDHCCNVVRPMTCIRDYAFRINVMEEKKRGGGLSEPQTPLGSPVPSARDRPPIFCITLSHLYMCNKTVTKLQLLCLISVSFHMCETKPKQHELIHTCEPLYVRCSTVSQACRQHYEAYSAMVKIY